MSEESTPQGDHPTDPADEAPGGQGPFDLVKLRELVEMMETHGLTEVHLRRGEERWQLRRGGEAIPMAAPVYQQPAALPTPPATPAPVETPAAGSGAPSAAASEGKIIKSEAVGTFYVSPTPDDPPFVEVGTQVDAETIVCIIEAMKVFNQIPAGINGVIAEVLVNNGDAVEYGTPLFRVTSG